MKQFIKTTIREFLNENRNLGLSYTETKGVLKEFTEGLKKGLEENKFSVVDNSENLNSLTTGEKIVIFFVDKDSGDLMLYFSVDFQDEILGSINRVLKSFGKSIMWSNPMRTGTARHNEKFTEVIRMSFQQGEM